MYKAVRRFNSNFGFRTSNFEAFVSHHTSDAVSYSIAVVKGADRAHSKVSSIKYAIEVLVPSASITVSRSGGVNTC